MVLYVGNWKLEIRHYPLTRTFRPHLFHLFAVQVFAVRHRLVDQTARSDFNNAVGHGIEQLVIVRGKNDVP